MAATTDHDTQIKELGELIKDITFAMLTTAESDGTLRSRPMGTIDREFDGTLWFFTQDHAAKADEVRQDSNVNLSYAEPNDNLYVSVSGTAQIVHDRAKMEEWWTPALKIWFEKGLDDPELALLKVTVTQAEYWKSPSSKVGTALAFATAYITGNDAALGKNEKIQL